MKNLHLICLIAVTLFGLGFIVTSCSKEDTAAPTVTVTPGETSDHFLTFTVTAENANECAWICIESENPVPSAESILASGNKTDAVSQTTVKANGLKPQTSYTIVAAASGKGGTATSSPITMTTQKQRSHTLIVYMMGNNGLEKFMDNNLNKIMGVADRSPENGRIAVFYDRGNYTRLTELVKAEDGRIIQDVIQEFAPDNTSSVDPDFMSRIIEIAKERMPAETYGLIMSSHGGGWVPSDTYDRYLMAENETKSLKRTTRFFGQDDMDCMEIPALSKALANTHYEYILFDACFMSSIEALYDMRKNTNYIIASSAEVLGTGFPYQEIIPLLFRSNHGLEESCESFMKLYRKSSGTISLIDCKELENLAARMKDINAVAGSVSDISQIQHYDGFKTHIFFDLEQYASAISPDKNLTEAFLNALRRAVPYTDHSPTFYTECGKPQTIDLPESCGLTCHIEQTADPEIHKEFLNTGWAKDTGAR